MTTRDDGYTPNSGDHIGDDNSPTFGDLLKQATGSLGGESDPTDRMEPHIGPQAPANGPQAPANGPQAPGAPETAGPMPEEPVSYQPEPFAAHRYGEPTPPGNGEYPPPPSGPSPSGIAWTSRRFDAKTVAVAFAIVGVAGSGLATWLAYRAGANSAGGGPVPYVQADYEATKRLPEDPGGLEVADRDKLIYGRLNGAPPSDGVERLLPLPEQPIARRSAGQPALVLPDRMPEVAVIEDGSQPVAAPRPAPIVTSLELPSARPVPAAAPAPVQSAPQAAMPPSFLPPTRDEAVARAPEISESVPVESLLAPVEQSAASDSWRIQLASLRQAGGAENAWAQLRQRHGGVLSRLSLYVQEARLDSGTFYRIQAGPLAGRAEAGAACEALKANGQPCIIVAP